VLEGCIILVKNNPTSKEHYIPQVYLNGFASKDKRIYFYDLKSHHHSDQMVPIKTVCYQRDLYEYKNSNNEIIYTNNIEKALNILETMFSQKRRSIRSRIKLAGPHTRTFLSDEEGAFWITYLVIQTLRLPKVINEITNVLEGIIPSNGEANFHRNTALYILLPFLNKLDPNGIELRLYNELFSSIGSLRCSIAFDDNHRLFTSDNPLYMYSPTQRIQDCQKIVFPLDSSICLLYNKDELYPDNGIVPIDDFEYESIFKSISYAADEKLFTNRHLTKQEIKWIKAVRIDKNEDISHDG